MPSKFHISAPLRFPPLFKLENISIQNSQMRSLFISLSLNFKGLKFASSNFQAIILRIHKKYNFSKSLTRTEIQAKMCPSKWNFKNSLNCVCRSDYLYLLVPLAEYEWKTHIKKIRKKNRVIYRIKLCLLFNEEYLIKIQIVPYGPSTLMSPLT